jgi:Ca-activated chloride channel family protein
MRLRTLLAGVLLLSVSAAAHGHGLLIPDEKTLPPLAMLNHKVSIVLEDQVAITTVEQTFRNHTDRALEATYLFPVPKGASVNRFTMQVNGKDVKGELVEADKARQIYTSIVRRTQDPGLLEYLGNNLFRLRVFPIPARGDQKVSLRFTAVAEKEGGVVEYVYPLKTDGKATQTLEALSITATVKSQHGVQNVYSPTHAISLRRKSDNEVAVSFDREQGLLDKDFLLFYSTGSKDVGLTALAHRPIKDEKGFFSLLISPRFELPKDYRVPRDLVLVLDTSGSMRGTKMEQARKALIRCLDGLSSGDRFALVQFATVVNRYDDKLQEATPDRLKKAKAWIEDLDATGGTAIDEALASALALRGSEEGRSFTVVFFTDGQPTIGESDPVKILKNAEAKNTSSTRIFTFGVGDDVNATLLDQLAEKTKALSSYVRPAEDIATKAAALSAKISHPVLTDLKLTTTNDVRLSEVYPPQLPDLFQGGQLVVFGRYTGSGPSAIRLKGRVGKEEREFVFETTFPAKTGESRDFVEQVWARRKVGYLLDQIRANGEKKELVDEITTLAKRYGITTPYTSYLIVPDATTPILRRPGAPVPVPIAGTAVPRALAGEGKDKNVLDFARRNQEKPGELETRRGAYADAETAKSDGKGAEGRAMKEAGAKKAVYDRARDLLQKKQQGAVQAGRLGVDLSVQMQNLRNQTRLDQSAVRQVQGRNCLEFGGIWIDEGFTAKTPVLVIKAQSDAYFKLLERHPKLKDVLQLGNHLVWVAPSGTALVIDTKQGKEKVTEAEIDKLFVRR